MSATFTAGFTYAAGATVSSANIDLLLTNTRLTNTDRDDVVLEDFSPVTDRSANTPPVGVVEDESWIGICEWPMTYQAGVNVPAVGNFRAPFAFNAILAANSGTIKAGSHLAVSNYDGTDLTVRVLPLGDDGVASQFVALTNADEGDRVPVVSSGVVKVLISATVTGGDAARASTTVTGSWIGFRWDVLEEAGVTRPRQTAVGTFLENQTFVEGGTNLAWMALYK